MFYCLVIKDNWINISGADALVGNTRSHPEHDGSDAGGRWYCIGDDVGEQVGAGSKKKTSEELVHIETDTGKWVLSETER